MNEENRSILLVDDEVYTLEFLSDNLNRNGYDVYTSSNGLEAIEKARQIKPRIILLDVMMPEMDGIETCHELRKISDLKNTVIAMLSARSEDYTQIEGFKAGADDYIVKPIRFKVLLSRLAALSKRIRAVKKDEMLAINDIQIISDKYLVIQNGKEISLPRREFELLSLLSKNPTKVFTRDEIFSRIWGEDTIVGEQTINVHVSRIRGKLNTDVIRTIKGVGYVYY
jgi:two-component system alkaline phosphatase synthesis response regulator PhoP